MGETQMNKKNSNEQNKGLLDLILIDTSNTIRQSKHGKADVKFSDYQDLRVTFTDKKGRPRLEIHFSGEIEGIQAEVSVLDSKGDSVSHLAAIFK
jgi:hypothetical protein